MAISRQLRYRSLVFFIWFVVSASISILLTQFIGLSPLDAQTLAGGETTVANRTSSAYEQPSAGLTEDNFARHREGDIAFEAVFVTPPAQVNPGLGPLFNNTSCVACHIRNGRGLPEKGQILVRVSDTRDWNIDTTVDPQQYNLESSAKADNAPAVPGLGTQIQDYAVYGGTPEAKVAINWQETTGKYGDGTKYTLRSPVAKVTLPNGDSLPSNVQTSLRLPPPVFGLGLIEALPESEIERLADPEDLNKDGISGRPNRVWNVEKQTTTLGKFSWKANNPTLKQQTASAYVNDMGVTNSLFPNEDGLMEIDEKTLDDATFYAQTLAVPARTMQDKPEVKRGEKLFQAQCATCHVATLQTGNYEVTELSNQTIHPYTDLLLHDMGAELADNRPDFLATGTEWRTPPLWGIGLTQTVLPYSGFLHDGRARTFEEAILWHGGEAKASREAFRKMNKSDREALVWFLRSL
ncbi:di-heme oxidoredictase family protein [Myxosarcina sp. GI1]|uniref:di-heme oxidoreductase family protein n=1 Tax=Myxosarcina sp. GI1 TaxID=1541065 RepID=UPI00056B2D13|nr:di-heme oxidoredictase family protein [Myxosarcina sp. GI1]